MSSSDTERIHIRTAQNVGIQYEIANPGDRLLAGILDGLVIFALSIFLTFVGSMLELRSQIYATFNFLMVIFYFPLCEIFFRGQTIGKSLRRIRVTSLDGSPARLGQFLIRWLTGFLEYWMFLGTLPLVILVVRPRGQRLGDIAAGTVVVKLRRSLTLEDTVLAGIQEDYQPVFAEAANLESGEAELIKDVLAAIEKSEDRKVRMNVATKAQRTFENKLGVSSSQNAISFLETLLSDYNFYQGR